MDVVLGRLRLLIGHLFHIWTICPTFAGLLIFCGAYLMIKLIKGMLAR